jgi:diguanylate cyclase (GGDEF)-like protein
LATNRSATPPWLAVAAASLVVAASGVIAVMWSGPATPSAMAFRFAGWAAPTLLAGYVLNRSRRASQSYLSVQSELTARSDALSRLLEFSQTIQGAGKPDQILTTLAYFLRTELGLSRITVLCAEPDAVPPLQIKSTWPEQPPGTATVAFTTEMDASLCPCLRQGLPKQFKPDGLPVRCSIDEAMALPASEPAYCVPFNVGRAQVLVHMLLPGDGEWTEQSRQLAQTYVNAASSSLITLNHLSEAEKQSMTDALTGLYNRRSMDQLLQREVALAERHSLPLSVVMIDMDHFKEINDAHGHAAGDHMLRAFADCVRMTLRKTDLAFRYGGDEFVIGLPQTPIGQAEQVVNKLRQAFAAVDFSDAIAHLEHPPTLSIGVTERSAANNVLTLPAILASADVALYEAKNDNRNCVRLYVPPKAA